MDEKYFFIMEKIDFENFVLDFLENIAKSYWFSIEFLLISYWKSMDFAMFSKKSKTKFFKINFLHEKKVFSSGFFFNLKSMISAFQRTQPHLLTPNRCTLGRVWVSETPDSASYFDFFAEGFTCKIKYRSEHTQNRCYYKR